MTRLRSWKKVSFVFLLCFATATAAQAQVFTTLLDFDGTDGAFPGYMSLVQGADGDLYGTTQVGGDTCFGNCGIVFKITLDGTLTTLHGFTGYPIEGANPDAGLVLAIDGNFYGTTSSGGSNSGCSGGCGTVFKITPGGILTTLHSFDVTEGSSSSAGLVQAIDGNFYGTTFYGGDLTCNSPLGCGTVFKITPSGTLTILHTFEGPDGEHSSSGLIQATDGSLYGTTSGGGLSFGTVFKIAPSGALTTLYNFCTRGCVIDGELPSAGLVQATDGNFYGTTQAGGAKGYGTVFKMTPSGSLTTLYSFCPEFGCADGDQPYAGLVQATDGNFYGTTMAGGADNNGAIFKITPDGSLTTLHSFDYTDGSRLFGGLLEATGGTLYGTAMQGGNGNNGTIFSLSMGLGPFVTFVRPLGRVGRTGPILGQGFTGTTGVFLNGTPASFTVVSDTLIEATVPVGATTGYVTVTTPSRTLTSNVPFHVIK